MERFLFPPTIFEVIDNYIFGERYKDLNPNSHLDDWFLLIKRLGFP